jgi:hypothetical protein
MKNPEEIIGDELTDGYLSANDPVLTPLSREICQKLKIESLPDTHFASVFLKVNRDKIGPFTQSSTHRIVTDHLSAYKDTGFIIEFHGDNIAISARQLGNGKFKAIDSRLLRITLAGLLSANLGYYLTVEKYEIALDA